jgi:hypothetical protein
VDASSVFINDWSPKAFELILQLKGLPLINPEIRHPAYLII